VLLASAELKVDKKRTDVEYPCSRFGPDRHCSALAVEQCRFIRRAEREACYERQAAALAAKRKL
jgi:hypothetical protein